MILTLHKDNITTSHNKELGFIWHINNEVADGGPYISENNAIYWFKDGKFHKVDGPAIEYSDGQLCWYLSGETFCFDEWLSETPISLEEKIIVKLRYG